MRRAAFIREMEHAGCALARHGSKHDIYVNLATGQKAPIPRHAEIKDSLCQLIRRQLGIAPPPGAARTTGL